MEGQKSGFICVSKMNNSLMGLECITRLNWGDYNRNVRETPEHGDSQ